MKRNIKLGLWVLGVLLAVAPAAAGAQELPIKAPSLGAKDFSMPSVDAQRLRLERTGIAAALEEGYVPKSGPCVCTNLGGVSVICPECDDETSENYCQTHDRACQDAAQGGGIREAASFFCTTQGD